MTGQELYPHQLIVIWEMVICLALQESSRGTRAHSLCRRHLCLGAAHAPPNAQRKPSSSNTGAVLAVARA